VFQNVSISPLNFTVDVSRPALEPTQPPIQWVLGALSLEIKRPGREADHSPPSSAEVKECVGLYLHSPNTPFMAWCSIKTQDNFAFTFTAEDVCLYHCPYVLCYRQTEMTLLICEEIAE
jgi:hypothetical protein